MSQEIVDKVVGKPYLERQFKNFEEIIQEDIAESIRELNVVDETVEGQYITSINETNGLISITREEADTVPTENSTKMITSGAVKTALNGTGKQIKNIQNNINVSGVRNFLKFPYISDSGLIGDTTFTINDDGTVRIEGGATAASANYYFTDVTSFFHPVEETYKIKLDGEIPEGETITFSVNAYNGDTFIKQLTQTIDESFIVDYNGYDRLVCYINRAESESTIDTILSPALLLASDEEESYTPYAMTNKELTDAVLDGTSSTISERVTNLEETIADLDYSDGESNGYYVTAVNQANGKISVTKQLIDTTPQSESSKAITSGGVYDAINNYTHNSTIDYVGVIGTMTASSTTWIIAQNMATNYSPGDYVYAEAFYNSSRLFAAYYKVTSSYAMKVVKKIYDNELYTIKYGSSYGQGEVASIATNDDLSSIVCNIYSAKITPIEAATATNITGDGLEVTEGKITHQTGVGTSGTVGDTTPQTIVDSVTLPYFTFDKYGHIVSQGTTIHNLDTMVPLIRMLDAIGLTSSLGEITEFITVHDNDTDTNYKCLATTVVPDGEDTNSKIVEGALLYVGDEDLTIEDSYGLSITYKAHHAYKVETTLVITGARGFTATIIPIYNVDQGRLLTDPLGEVTY